MGIIQAIFDTLVKEYNNIVTPIETETKPRALNGNIVNTTEIDMSGK